MDTIPEVLEKVMMISRHTMNCLIGVLVIYIVSCQRDKPGNLLLSQLEADIRFIASDSLVFFTALDSLNFQVYTYDTRDSSIFSQPDGRDHFQPFLYKSKLETLVDNNGDEKFVTTNEALNKVLSDHVDKIYTFANGRYLIARLKSSGEIVFIDSAEREVPLYPAQPE